LSWPWNSSTNLYESGICTLELYTKIFAEPVWGRNGKKMHNYWIYFLFTYFYFVKKGGWECIKYIFDRLHTSSDSY
jgi:hypothetical protein